MQCMICRIIRSIFLFILHHLPDIDPQVIFDEHKRWAEIHAPVNHMEVVHDNIADPDRRLRIGYISPDFRMHPVAFFVEPLLNGHNREDVEIYGYGNVAKPEAATEFLKPKFDYYRNIYGLDITERKRAEEALRKSENRYRMVSELISDYIFKLTVNSDGTVVMDEVTENYSMITGRTLEEVKTPGLWSKILPPDAGKSHENP